LQVDLKPLSVWLGHRDSESIPAVKVRQAITGFLFGSVGAGISLHPLDVKQNLKKRGIAE
jgi:hypothetical protein